MLLRVKLGFQHFSETLFGNQIEFNFLWIAFSKDILLELFYYGELKKNLSMIECSAPSNYNPQKRLPDRLCSRWPTENYFNISVFQTELIKEPKTINWLDIYFDIDAKDDVQDSQFIALEKSEVKHNHIPLNILFDVKIMEHLFETILIKIEFMRLMPCKQLFKKYKFPLKLLKLKITQELQ